MESHLLRAQKETRTNVLHTSDIDNPTKIATKANNMPSQRASIFMN